MRTHHQPHSHPMSKKRPPKVPHSLLPDPLELSFDEENEDEYHYSHGLSENVDWYQSHHLPYDLEDDAQEFYNRIIYGSKIS